jgi:hypothetical protein
MIFVLLIVISLHINCFTTDVNNYNKYYGFWGEDFPMGSIAYGYIFFPDSRFLYYTFPYPTLYDGSTGEYKIEKEIIYIKINYNYYWEKSWEEKNGYYFTGNDNYINAKKHINEKWIPIGTFGDWQIKNREFLNKVNQLSDHDLIFDEKNWPPYIILKKIEDGIVVNNEGKYYKYGDFPYLLNDAWYQKKIKKYETAKKNTE